MKPVLTRIATASLIAAPIIGAQVPSTINEGLIADGFSTHLELLAGTRVLDDGFDVAGADTTTYGVTLNFQTRGLDWSVGPQISYTYAENNEQNQEAEISVRDLAIGFFVPFGEPSGFNFDFGAGFSQTWIDIGLQNGTKEAIRASGAYIRSAARYPIADWADATVAARYTYAEADSSLAGETDLNAGGIGLWAGIGIRF